MKQSPYFDINYGWPRGSDGWNIGMDENLLVLSFLSTNQVLDVVDSVPDNPAEGDAYVLTSDNSARFFADSSWHITYPADGWEFKTLNTNLTWVFENGSPVQRTNPDNLAGQVEGLENRVDGVDAQLSTVNDQLNLLTDIPGRVTELESNSVTQEQLNQVENSVTDVEQAVEGLDDAVSNIDTTVTVIQNNLTNLQESVEGKMDSVVAGEGVTVDSTDPLNPIISATGAETLRQDLEDPDMGAAMVARATVEVGSIAGLLIAPYSAMGFTQKYKVDGFYAGQRGKGRTYSWNSETPKSSHDGVNVIDPVKLESWDGTPDTLEAFFSPGAAGTGCFVMSPQDTYCPTWCGLLGGAATTTDGVAFAQLLKVVPSNGSVKFPSSISELSLPLKQFSPDKNLRLIGHSDLVVLGYGNDFVEITGTSKWSVKDFEFRGFSHIFRNASDESADISLHLRDVSGSGSVFGLDFRSGDVSITCKGCSLSDMERAISIAGARIKRALKVHDSDFFDINNLSNPVTNMYGIYVANPKAGEHGPMYFNELRFNGVFGGINPALGTGTGYVDAIHVNRGSFVKISACKFKNIYRQDASWIAAPRSIYVMGCKSVHITSGNDFDDAGDYGVITIKEDCENVVIDGFTVKSSYSGVDHTINLQGAKRVKLSNGIFEGKEFIMPMGASGAYADKVSISNLTVEAEDVLYLTAARLIEISVGGSSFERSGLSIGTGQNSNILSVFMDSTGARPMRSLVWSSNSVHLASSPAGDKHIINLRDGGNLGALSISGGTMVGSRVDRKAINLGTTEIGSGVISGVAFLNIDGNTVVGENQNVTVGDNGAG